MKNKPLHPRTTALHSALLAAFLIGGSAAGLSACNRHEDPAETAKDMSEARKEGNDDVRDAAKDAAQDQGENLKEAVSDTYKVEIERCVPITRWPRNAATAWPTPTRTSAARTPRPRTRAPRRPSKQSATAWSMGRRPDHVHAHHEFRRVTPRFGTGRYARASAATRGSRPGASPATAGRGPERSGYDAGSSRGGPRRSGTGRGVATRGPTSASTTPVVRAARASRPRGPAGSRCPSRAGASTRA